MNDICLKLANLCKLYKLFTKNLLIFYLNYKETYITKKVARSNERLFCFKTIAFLVREKDCVVIGYIYGWYFGAVFRVYHLNEFVGYNGVTARR